MTSKTPLLDTIAIVLTRVKGVRASLTSNPRNDQDDDFLPDMLRERLQALWYAVDSGRMPATPRTVPDFLIGAHALLQCQGLITRDAGFFRDYFKGLKVIVPKA